MPRNPVRLSLLLVPALVGAALGETLTGQVLEEGTLKALAEAGEPLTGEELRKVEHIRRETGRLFCRRCGYCQPCPERVPLPVVMVFGSRVKRFGPEVAARRWGASLEKARACTECGQCEEKCPYDLPIRERLKEMLSTYESILAGTYVEGA